MPINVTFYNPSGTVVSSQSDLPLPFESSTTPVIQSTVNNAVLFSSGEYQSAVSGNNNFKYDAGNNLIIITDPENRWNVPISAASGGLTFYNSNQPSNCPRPQMHEFADTCNAGSTKDFMKFIGVVGGLLVCNGFKFDYCISMNKLSSRIGTVFCTWDTNVITYQPDIMDTSLTSDHVYNELKLPFFTVTSITSGSDVHIVLGINNQDATHNVAFSCMFTTFTTS